MVHCVVQCAARLACELYGYQRGIGSPKGVLNRRQWAREGPGAR